MATSLFDFTQQNYSDPSGINWNFYKPGERSQYGAMDVGSGSGSINPIQTNFGEDFYKALGYNGQAWNTPSNQDLVGGTDSHGSMNPDFQNWLNQQGYTFGAGTGGGNMYGGYFDPSGNLVGQMAQNSNDPGPLWTLAQMFLGGYGLSGLLGSAGLGAGAAEGGGADALAGGGAGGADAGLVGFNPAVDSHLANLGGTQATVAAGMPLDPSAVWGGAGGGLTGSSVASAVPPSVDLGSLGGPLATGAGVAAAAGSGANNPSAYIPGETTTGPGMPGNPPNVGSAFPTPSTNLSDLFSSGKLQDMISKGLQGGLAGLTSPEGLKGLFGIYNANQQKDLWDKQFANIDQMFSPDSPYAKQMEETLARKDSAAGRNSQYGPRAQALAADLTGQKARMVSDLNNIISRQQDMMQSRATDLAAILGSTGLLNGLSSGVSSLFNELFGLLEGD